ncbi:hypothetical protein niasHT_014037 [Heterodera trifolii]|uniref:Uncharacterized protein n=1 Tax=Heterodera trifolii TaxID=157864 RepID=A0ABD2LGC9_9BILA
MPSFIHSLPKCRGNDPKMGREIIGGGRGAIGVWAAEGSSPRHRRRHPLTLPPSHPKCAHFAPFIVPWHFVSGGLAPMDYDPDASKIHPMSGVISTNDLERDTVSGGHWLL